MNNLREMFHSMFKALDANTPERRELVYRLRYQVYCIETGFEDLKRFPDHRERDDYDDVSEHGLILSRKTGWPVATVRLVRPCLEPGLVFPIEGAYPGLLESRGFGRNRLPYESTAEISRFAISNVFKRRPGESGTLTGASEKSLREGGSVDVDGRRHFPHIILGLYYLLIQLSAKSGVTHWVAVMEPALLRLLARFAVDFVPMGEPIEFHGRRQVCSACVEDVLAKVYVKRPDIWDLVTEGGATWPPPAPYYESTAGTPQSVSAALGQPRSVLREVSLLPGWQYG